jgi:hypothetical protein
VSGRQRPRQRKRWHHRAIRLAVEQADLEAIPTGVRGRLIGANRTELSPLLQDIRQDSAAFA